MASATKQMRTLQGYSPQQVCEAVKIGTVFGSWTVISEMWIDSARAKRVRTRCVCGKEFDNYVCRLLRGASCSCGCQRNLKRTKPFLSVYLETKKRAKKRGKEFLLSYEDYVDFAKNPFCFYCDEPLFWPEYGRRSRASGPPKGYLSSNIDRKDNSVGYVKENIVSCCSRCNKVKGKFLSFEEMVEVGKILKRRHYASTSK
jgi:hypothetical protein